MRESALDCVVHLSLNCLCDNILVTLTEQQGRGKENDEQNRSLDAVQTESEKITFDKNNNKDVGLLIQFIFPLLFLLLWILVDYTTTMLPQPKSANINISDYSETRARYHLKNIVSIGVRTVGSRNNEVIMVNYLNSQYESLKREFPDRELMMEFHHPSGAFSTGFLEGFTNVYDNVTNVLFYVPGNAPEEEQKTVLLSAHFDSSLGTVAASDDAVMIASMLEILRNILSAKQLKHSIVMNFNGAEETNWMAAHGFITQHHWRHQIRAMINLEGAGSGGREMVLQTGPGHSWIAETYAAVAPYPHGSTLGQEIFQSGIIPGETDFQVYRDYGGKHIEGIDFIPGVDMVSYQKGHVYHTTLDDYDHIDSGAMQRTGENILATLRALASSAQLVDPGDSKHHDVIYYDILGIFMVVYTRKTEFVLNTIALSLIPFSIYLTLTHLSSILTAMVVSLISVFGSVLFSFFVSSFITIIGKSLSWYSCYETGVIFYVFVAIWGTLFIRHKLHSWVLPHHSVLSLQAASEESFFFGSVFVVGIFFGICFYYRIGSAYLLIFWILPVLIGRIIARKPSRLLISTVFLLNSTGQSVGRVGFTSQFWIVHLLCIVPGLVLSIQTILLTFGFFFPLMGRSGTIVPPELIVGPFVSILVSLSLLVPLSVFHAFDKKQRSRFLKITGFITFLLFLILMSRFPYDNEHPKRLFAQHISRQWFDSKNIENSKEIITKEETGVLFFPFDYLSMKPILDTNNLSLFKEKKNIYEEYQKECEGLMCSLPFYFPLDFIINKYWYVNTPDYVKHLNFNVKLENDQISEIKKVGKSFLRRKMSFQVSGPPHLGIIISADSFPSSALVDWSFGREVVEDGEHKTTFPDAVKPFYRHKCNCYYIFRASGNSSIPWKFYLIFENENISGEKKLNDVPVEFSFFAHWPEETTSHLQKLKSEMPSWVTFISFASAWQYHKF
eukprot:c18414_g1_i2.p1 GENE.c18414_g1_i2~~c18414_g1_i2.p1  ORF type:complete len:955 (+),score=351.01 c18414_g1_i2:74-2938(+)